jgi:hypothetical protein
MAPIGMTQWELLRASNGVGGLKFDGMMRDLHWVDAIRIRVSDPEDRETLRLVGHHE